MAYSPQRKIAQIWTKRPSFMHKGKVGSVLMIGGSPTYAGAPILASVAALRAGTGKVVLAALRK
mgnify:CR=1 FL=1